jgi:hypothetical protein
MSNSISMLREFDSSYLDCGDSYELGRMRERQFSDGPATSSMSIPPKWHGRDGKVAAAARETV